MGFSLIWTEEQVDKVSENFSYRVSDSLASTLEDKERQVKWCRSMSDLSARVHRMFNLDSLTVAELRFSAMSAEYRALCVVLPDEETVFYYSTVPKEGSAQKRKLSLMRENSGRIEAYFSEKY